MTDRRRIQRNFDLMFPGLALQESARARGDDQLYNRLVERSRIKVDEALSANKSKSVEESTLAELENLIGYPRVDFKAEIDDFYHLERKDGEIVVYPGNQVKFISVNTKEEIFRTFLADEAA